MINLKNIKVYTRFDEVSFVRFSWLYVWSIWNWDRLNFDYDFDKNTSLSINWWTNSNENNVTGKYTNSNTNQDVQRRTHSVFMVK